MNLLLGDCIEKMRELPENSVDAIITDPPYGLEFMGKDWDGYGTPKGFENWTRGWATEALRVLKEGGFMFAFGGTRTYHRLTCGIEDAGFQIRDCIAWTYASGFPKAQDLAMQTEKKLGGKGEVVGNKDGIGSKTGETYSKNGGFKEGEYEEKKPTIPQAKRLIGWKTPALKPAYEPIVVAQKPIKGTIADNMLKNNVGGYNVDECRIPYESEGDAELVDFNRRGTAERSTKQEGESLDFIEGGWKAQKEVPPLPNGRFPPNLLSEDEVLDDGRVTISEGGTNETNTKYTWGRGGEKNRIPFSYNDKGSFNRYFSLDAWWDKQLKTLPKEAQKTFPFLYCPKAGKSEKNEGCNDFFWKDGNPITEEDYLKYKTQNEIAKKNNKKLPNAIAKGNIHPTVKSLKIKTYLIKLATMEGATILDPFMGSGTTGIACYLTNRKFIGIEQSEEYMKIAKARIGHYTKQQKLNGTKEAKP